MSRRRQFNEESALKINLSNGASVSLTFRGNLFDLGPEERKLIGELCATVQTYKNPPKEAANG